MPVVRPEGRQFATGAHLDEGGTIKLTKGEQGRHHWIPQRWITRFDQHVHIDRPGDQAMKEWSTTEPQG